MRNAAKPTSASDRLAQLRMTREQTIERQKALRPQIRAAKQRGDHEQAQALHDELRELRARLRRLQQEERTMNVRDAAM